MIPYDTALLFGLMFASYEVKIAVWYWLVLVSVIRCWLLATVSVNMFVCIESTNKCYHAIKPRRQARARQE